MPDVMFEDLEPPSVEQLNRGVIKVLTTILVTATLGREPPGRTWE